MAEVTHLAWNIDSRQIKVGLHLDIFLNDWLNL